MLKPSNILLQTAILGKGIRSNSVFIIYFEILLLTSEAFRLNKEPTSSKHLLCSILKHTINRVPLVKVTKNTVVMQCSLILLLKELWSNSCLKPGLLCSLVSVLNWPKLFWSYSGHLSAAQSTVPEFRVLRCVLQGTHKSQRAVFISVCKTMGLQKFEYIPYINICTMEKSPHYH